LPASERQRLLTLSQQRQQPEIMDSEAFRKRIQELIKDDREAVPTKGP
jgi:hypothetical protein